MNILKRLPKGAYHAVQNIFSNALLLMITLLIPKTDKIVIVGSWYGKRFSDNSKYFYLYANQNKNKLGITKLVWITRSETILDELRQSGHKVYKAGSLHSTWYHLRASMHVVDHSSPAISRYFSFGRKIINLWHGFPLKKIPAGKKFSWLDIFSKFCPLKGTSYLLVTSELSSQTLGSAFNIPEKNRILSGYPRNYNAFTKHPIEYITQNEKPYFEKIKAFKQAGYKVIAYLPTFRDQKITLPFGTTNPDEWLDLLNSLDRMGVKLLAKFHFAGKNDTFKAIDHHDALITLPSEVDVYTFLKQVDILITDYSSIYFDCLLWNKPLVFFPFDLDFYRNEDRGLLFDYDEFTPGPKVKNITELKSLFSNGIESFLNKYHEQYKTDADALAAKIFGDYKRMDICHLFSQIHAKS